MILIIDNYDSFTYNLFQMVGEIYNNILVKRNDEITIEQIKTLKPNGIIISPGPGNPGENRDFGISMNVIKELGSEIPILGVFNPKYVDIIAQVLKNIGVKRAMVVHGYDENDKPAMDEISTIGKTRVAFLEKGHIKIQEIYPEDFGLKRCNPKFIKAPETIEENLEVIKSILNGKNNSKEDNARLEICLVNTAAILFLAGKAKNFKEGVKLAKISIESGMATQKLLKLIDISNS